MGRYRKENSFVRVDTCNRFIYEVTLYVFFENICNQVQHKYFSSEKEIPKIVSEFNINNNMVVYTELIYAPKRWLIENDYQLYVKPEKKKRIKKDGSEIKIT